MSDPVPGDTVRPESKDQFPPLCVLCGNTIQEEQESGISAAGARYHADCVAFESSKEESEARTERREAKAKEKQEREAKAREEKEAKAREDKEARDNAEPEPK